jgi:alpha-ribazole phosphatase/probable phosphoglycerate mutase
MSSTRIDILRHGMPEGGRRYRGHGVDDPLSELGWRQMWAAVGDAKPWDVIVSSPMARCRPFAEALAARSGLAVTVDERLKEVGFGDWEGRTADEVRAADPHAIRRFYEDPVGARPGGAEPLDRFNARVREALQEILAIHDGRRVLVVAHAGVMRAVVSWMLDVPLARMYRMDIANAALLRIRTKSERPPQIVFSGPMLG